MRPLLLPTLVSMTYPWIENLLSWRKIPFRLTLLLLGAIVLSHSSASVSVSLISLLNYRSALEVLSARE